MKWIAFLNKPFPVALKRWPIIISVSLFIGLFIYLFQPFGLQALEIEYKSFILLGYGLVTFIFLYLFLLVFPKLFNNFFAEENWKVWKEIFWLNVILIGIASGNYLYSVALDVFAWMGWLGFSTFILYTLPIALIPASIVTIIQQNISLRRNLRSSDQINTSIREQEIDRNSTAKQITVQSEQGESTYNLDDILYMVSDGNYVKIYYSESDKEQSDMLRSTLKNIIKQVENTSLFHCHRAYIVNLSKIEKVDGNSQGYLLKLNDSTTIVPVSRSFLKSFDAVFLGGK